MRSADYLSAIVDDLRENADFLSDVDSHGRLLGDHELRQLSLKGPSCRVALLGTRGGSGGSVAAVDNVGRIKSPLVLVAFLIEHDATVDGKHVEARVRVIELTDAFIEYIQHRTFGLHSCEAGPILFTGFEILYSPEIEAAGCAVAAVGLEAEVRYGANLHYDDIGLIQPDGFAGIGPRFTEGEWKEQDLIDVGLLSKGQATGIEDKVTRVDPEQVPDRKEQLVEE